jgi:hypothetical protein
MGQWINDLAAQHREFARRLAERQSLTIPAEDPGYADIGPAFPAWTGTRTDAILQPARARDPRRPRGSSTAPWTGTWTWRPRTDSEPGYL